MIFSSVSTPDIHVAPWVQILLIFRISLNWSILHILNIQWWDYDQLIVMGVAMQKEEKWDTADAGPQHFWNTSGYISSISLTPGSGNTTWLGLNSASDTNCVTLLKCINLLEFRFPQFYNMKITSSGCFKCQSHNVKSWKWVMYKKSV